MENKKILIIGIVILLISLSIGSYYVCKNIYAHNGISKTKEQAKEEIYNNEENNITFEEEKEEIQQQVKEETTNEDNNDNQTKNDKNKSSEIESNNTSNDTNSSNTSSNTSSSSDKTTTSNIPSKYELKTLGNLKYYLYSPSNPTSNMPLIMYLHGGTNKKSDVSALLTTDGFPKYLYDGYYGNLRAYVVIPKLESNYTGWVDVYSELRNLIKEMNTNYKISLNKVSLTGHSMGGTGTYQVQIKLSSTFACIAPMSGSVKNTEDNINALSKTKIWAFVGTNDKIVDPSSTRTIIEVLKNKGANVRITEFEGTDHFGVPSLGYKNSEFIKWLVNCSK